MLGGVKKLAQAKKATGTGKRRLVRINAAALSEDDADHLFYLKHQHEQRRKLEEVAHQAGREVDRRVS